MRLKARVESRVDNTFGIATHQTYMRSLPVNKNMRVLVVIASYGRNNDQYLDRVLNEYRKMTYEVDIVVLSNLTKDLGKDVNVVVSVPNGNPWSLPFRHKEIFADRVDHYDLFIYSEDDILISEENINAFLHATEILPNDEIAGFFHSETDPEGRCYYVAAHSSYHWDPGSVRTRGEYMFAFFTNEHSASYALTRDQLRRAIRSGGFLVDPHDERYDLLVSAATDPYTRCGFTKLICVSHLEQFTVRHLPNKKYKGRPYEEKSEFHKQIEALIELENNGGVKTVLFEVEPRVGQGKWAKQYYEPIWPRILSAFPTEARSILSVGCGWGALEGALVEKGMRVVAVPLDSVIASCAKGKGVEVVSADFSAAREQLSNDRFDCVLMSYVLHLLSDPVEILSSFAELLSDHGKMVLVNPNFNSLSTLWRRLWRDSQYKDLGNYAEVKMRLTTRRSVKEWLQACNMEVEKTVDIVSGERSLLVDRLLFGVAGPLWASEFITIGKRRQNPTFKVGEVAH